MPSHTKPYANVLETIGWTPLVRLNAVTQGIRTPVYAKAEFFNPGGSVKDRIGVAMIEAAEREGRLKPGGLIVEATSGNTGVGLAIAAAVKGYHCIFTMPDKMSQEKARLLRALGAEVIITPTAVAPDHPDNYIMKGRAIAAAHPNAIFADQHFNPVNPEAHYRTTGPEIWEQTSGKVSHLVCAPGTGGTVTGAGRYLKERNPKIRVIAGDPVGSIYTEYARTHRKTEGAPYKVEGIGGDKIPTALDFSVVDEWMFVSDKDAFLDQFFSKASLDGKNLAFTTKPVHGTWYEFSGVVARGEAKMPDKEGYWVIQGTLKQNEEDENKRVFAKSREVAFKSFPQDTDQDQTPK